MNTALKELCAAYGVIWRYKDGAGKPKEAPEETCIAILNAMGLDIQTETDLADRLEKFEVREKQRLLPDYQVVETNTVFKLSLPRKDHVDWRIEYQNGTQARGVSHGGVLDVPPLPMGVHTLFCENDSCSLLSAPARLPPPARGWGLMAPLYGLKSTLNSVIGDFTDLQDIAIVSASLGAGFVGVNPVHAGFPEDPEACSPYTPSSRQRLNPLHISVDQPSQNPAAADPNPSSDQTTPLIDYASVKKIKNADLEVAFAEFQTNGDVKEFEKFIIDGAQDLRDFSTHQILSEEHGPYWHLWPTPFQSPNTAETRQFAKQHEKRLRYHSWLQWRASRQLKDAQDKAIAAGMAYGLYLDLAVGTHPFGAETWADEGAFARGVSLGAPSDSFDATGQNWQLVPFNPLQLTARKFAPLIATLRSQLDFAGLLRVDHILGFERSFWIPDGLPGAYVTLPRDALFAIIRMEAARAGACIVGEDLGNVPDGLRDALAQSGILGCRVAFFERIWNADKSFVAGEDYTELALASVTTHDLPTLLGWCKGHDIDWRHHLGELPDPQAEIQQQDREADLKQFQSALRPYLNNAGAPRTDLESDAALTLAAYTFLANTRSALVAVQVEDVLQLVEQPNLPGTISSHPNWRRRLPRTAKEIASLDLMKRISQAMKTANRPTE